MSEQAVRDFYSDHVLQKFKLETPGVVSQYFQSEFKQVNLEPLQDSLLLSSQTFFPSTIEVDSKNAKGTQNAKLSSS